MSKHVKWLCVYCGSGTGHNPLYAEAADALGQAMVEAGIGLVYGGGGVGLMGAVARSVLRNKGQVIGIIPDFLIARERMLRDVQELLVTKSMHERKQKMFEKSDAFVALPGGIGTLEELVEQLTWTQLGQHAKPIVLADIDGFWTPLLSLIQHMREEAFIRKDLNVELAVVDSADKIIPEVIAMAERAALMETDEAVASKF